MRTLSVALRKRILASYDNQEGSRQEIADRYRVSLSMVKKLLEQRRRTGEIGPRRSGRKPIIIAPHYRKMQALLAEKPDLTLKELRDAVELKCSLPAIHYALAEMGLTYKKRHSGSACPSRPPGHRSRPNRSNSYIGSVPDNARSKARPPAASP